MKPEDIEGFEIEYRDYTFYRNDRLAIVEQVPYLRDPMTDELYLHASVAERLWDLTHRNDVPTRQVLTDMITFSESELTHA